MMPSSRRDFLRALAAGTALIFAPKLIGPVFRQTPAGVLRPATLAEVMAPYQETLVRTWTRMEFDALVIEATTPRRQAFVAAVQESLTGTCPWGPRG
jgi:hypothetical protein